MQAVQVSLLTLLLSQCIIVQSISLLDAYRSNTAVARRQGMFNTRFRPVAHLRGNDDWKKQIGQEVLVDQMMDENGVIYDLRPAVNDRVTNFFNSFSSSSRFGKR